MGGSQDRSMGMSSMSRSSGHGAYPKTSTERSGRRSDDAERRKRGEHDRDRRDKDRSVEMMLLLAFALRISNFVSSDTCLSALQRKRA